jgi:hypothetical protein
MPHGHGFDNCNLRFCRKGRQLDLGESKSLTQIFQQNLLSAFHRLWAYVCALDLGLMVMMVMVMMVVVMVPKAFSQVGWLRQRQCQSFNRLKPSIGQSFHKLKVQWAQRFLWKRYSCRNATLSSTALKQALKQALK